MDAEKQKTGVELIAAERKRQIEKEGWTPQHDNGHGVGELAMAAACYAAGREIYTENRLVGCVQFDECWPWEAHWDKRGTHSTLRQWQIAGALIAAEIDKFLRKYPERLRDAYVPATARLPLLSRRGRQGRT